MIYLNPRINLLLLLAIKMVLCGAVAGAGDVTGNASRVRRSPQPHHAHRVMVDDDFGPNSWKRSHWREMQSILRLEGSQRNVVECCPSVLEMVAKKGGATPTGMYVELYEDGEHKQRLYELSCAPGVVDKPCRFVDARLYNQSRCVQRYSYSYALVRYTSATELPETPRPAGHFSVPGSGGWSMDYIKIRSGCECEITPPASKRKHKKRERHSGNKRKKKYDEDDT